MVWNVSMGKFFLMLAVMTLMASSGEWGHASFKMERSSAVKIPMASNFFGETRILIRVIYRQFFKLVLLFYNVDVLKHICNWYMVKRDGITCGGRPTSR